MNIGSYILLNVPLIILIIYLVYDRYSDESEFKLFIKTLKDHERTIHNKVISTARKNGWAYPRRGKK